MIWDNPKPSIDRVYTYHLFQGDAVNNTQEVRERERERGKEREREGKGEREREERGRGRGRREGEGERERESSTKNCCHVCSQSMQPLI